MEKLLAGNIYICFTQFIVTQIFSLLEPSTLINLGKRVIGGANSRCKQSLKIQVPLFLRSAIILIARQLFFYFSSTMKAHMLIPVELLHQNLMEKTYCFFFACPPQKGWWRIILSNKVRSLPASPILITVDIQNLLQTEKWRQLTRP